MLAWNAELKRIRFDLRWLNPRIATKTFIMVNRNRDIEWNRHRQQQKKTKQNTYFCLVRKKCNNFKNDFYLIHYSHKIAALKYWCLCAFIHNMLWLLEFFFFFSFNFRFLFCFTFLSSRNQVIIPRVHFTCRMYDSILLLSCTKNYFRHQKIRGITFRISTLTCK